MDRKHQAWGVPLALVVGVAAYTYSTHCAERSRKQLRQQILAMRVRDKASLHQLRREGYRPEELVAQGLSLSEIEKTGVFSAKELKEARTARPPPPAPRHPPHLSSSSSSHPFGGTGGSNEKRSVLSGWKDAVQRWAHPISASATAPPPPPSGRLSAKGEGGRRGDDTEHPSTLSSSSRLGTAGGGPGPHPAPNPNENNGSASSMPIGQDSSVCVSAEATFADLSRPVFREMSVDSGGRVQAQVGKLCVQLSRGYVEEVSQYRFPIESHLYRHSDGSQLTLFAEECSAVDGLLSTELYAARSVDRIRTVAEKQKVFFKLQLLARASAVVTTAMEMYANLQLGPSPIMIACFFLVRDGVAYVIQLQAYPNEYEERLPDLLATVQSASLLLDGCGVGMQPHTRGHNVFHLQDKTQSRSYLIHLPTEFVVQRACDECRHVLTVRHRVSRTWRGRIVADTVQPNRGADERGNGEQEYPLYITLLPDEVYFYVQEDTEAQVEVMDVVYRLITSPQTKATPLLSAALPPGEANCYVSPELRVPLPLCDSFLTRVCEHAGDRFITLLIRTPNEAELFEVELQALYFASSEEYNSFLRALSTLFLTQVHPKKSKRADKKERTSVEGLSATAPDTTLLMDTLRVSPNIWLVARWVFSDSCVVSQSLQCYRDRLLDDVVWATVPAN